MRSRGRLPEKRDRAEAPNKTASGEGGAEALPRHPGRAAQVRVRMRHRDEPGLVLGGRQEDAALAHRVEEDRVTPRVRALRLGEVPDRPNGEEERQQRAEPREVEAV